MTAFLVNAVADRDVDEIVAYTHQYYGKVAATVFETRLDALYDRVLAFPQSGSPRPSLGSDIRIGLVSPYIVIYRYRQAIDTVEVLRILHGHRDIDAGALPS